MVMSIERKILFMFVYRGASRTYVVFVFTIHKDVVIWVTMFAQNCMLVLHGEMLTFFKIGFT